MESNPQRKSRSGYSALNAFTGVFGQMIIIILGFITRTVFIYSLGKEYLGISGLFQNILQILSISDLGLESAIVFSLYKPLNENDENKITVIINFYKKAYRIIGIVILIFGLCLFPLLPFLVKGKSDLVDINIIFGLYLAQTVSSYLCFAYRKTIYVADQRNYKCSLISTVSRFFISGIQIVTLLIWKNYYVYMIVEIAFALLSNIIIGILAGRDYPCIKIKTKEKMPADEYSNLKQNVIGSFFYKVCGVVTNSTDNLLISSMIGIAVVGVYSNYLLFTNYIQLFLSIIFNGATSSIGNLYVSEDKEKSEFVFCCLNILNFWFYGFCAIAYFCLIDEFILLWLGDASYLLSIDVVFLSFFYIALVGLQYSVKSYRSACGLFWKGKIRPILTVIINLAVSIVLGHYIGLAGILLGTIVSHITTLLWYDPMLLYREVFHKKATGYFIRYTVNLLAVVAVGIGLYALMSLMPSGVIFFIIRLLIVIIVPNALFLLIYHKSKEFQYIKNTFLMPFVNKIKKKLKKG